MKFVGLSLFLHSLLLVAVAVHQHPQQEDTPIPMVELIRPAVPDISSGKRQSTRRQEVRKKNQTHKSLAKARVKKAPEEPSAAAVAEAAGRALTYKQELNLYLRRNKKYPQRALKLRQSGVVQLKVIISRDGEFQNVQVLKPSSFQTLDKAAKNLILKLGRFKPLPRDYKGSGEFIIPVAYQLRGS